jgi:hypothetical protein
MLIRTKQRKIHTAISLNHFWVLLCHFAFLYVRGPHKIAFVTRTCEIFSGKAEGQKRHRHSQSYVEDAFWPDNAAGGDCSRSK